MSDRITFSHANQNLDEIAESYNLMTMALERVRHDILRGIDVPDAFIGYSHPELAAHFDKQGDELNRTMCLNLIAAVEARFHKDYLERVYNRKKDPLSRRLRDVYTERGHRASFDEHILEAWKEVDPRTKSAVGEFKGALKFRHWLSHGRYWVPRLGRAYDFFSVFTICEAVESRINFIDAIYSA